LLSLILGCHPEVDAPGELNKLVRVWRRGDFCTCGERVRECAFWTAVWRDWMGANGLAGTPPYEELQGAVEWPRHLPMLLARRRRRSLAFRHYAEATTRLFDTIAALSGCPVVVDSSKAPRRAYALTQTPGLDVRLIHLVRDPRGVCYSMTKALRKDLEAGVGIDRPGWPIRKTAMHWMLRTTIAAWIRRRHGADRAILVRYEDLVADPLTTLERIGVATGLDLSEVARGLAQGQTIRPRHVAIGNQMRMAKEIRVQIDDEWARSMHPRDRRLVEILTGPWLRALGY
jgi:hypothetical protein